MSGDLRGLRSPLSRARGLGAAHAGTGHWLQQRLTALANLLLLGWLAWAALTLNDWSYGGFTHWLARPVIAIPFILALISVCLHASLGLQVIAEDYIHGEGRKLAAIIGVRFYFIGLAVIGIFAVLCFAFAGRAHAADIGAFNPAWTQCTADSDCLIVPDACRRDVAVNAAAASTAESTFRQQASRITCHTPSDAAGATPVCVHKVCAVKVEDK